MKKLLRFVLTFILIFALVMAVDYFLPDLLGKKKALAEAEQVDAEQAAIQEEIDATAEENRRLMAELAQLRAEMESKKNE